MKLATPFPEDLGCARTTRGFGLSQYSGLTLSQLGQARRGSWCEVGVRQGMTNHIQDPHPEIKLHLRTNPASSGENSWVYSGFRVSEFRVGLGVLSLACKA